MNMITHDYKSKYFKLFVFSTKFQTFENNFAILESCKYINPPNNCKGYKIRLFRICFSFFRHYTTKGSKNITHSAQPSEWSYFVNVFPNPANDNLTISHNLETKDGKISLEIMDVMGRVLLNNTINNTNHQIDISQLA